MPAASAKTFFAPADRATRGELDESVRLVVGAPVTKILLNNIGVLLLVLDENRQIVAANHDFAQALGFSSAEDFLGLRPGEALDCVNACKQPGGCGTDGNCRYCGAVCAILESQATAATVIRECHILTRGERPAAYDFRIHATALELESRRFTVFALHQINEETRRQAIERAFFHDVRNTLSGISGWSDVLTLGGSEKEIDDIAAKIKFLVLRLAEDIDSHRILLEAEKGGLEAEFSEITIAELLQALEVFVSHHDCANAKSFSPNAGGLAGRVLETSQSLLLRVLFNMTVNALEATPPGGTATLRVSDRAGQCLFSVHNAGTMSPEARAQVFQRGFSTKAKNGRGFGTYSMKLLGEKYLDGNVWFESSPETGTGFFCQLPWRRPASVEINSI